jgi:hypothetical protein
MHVSFLTGISRITLHPHPHPRTSGTVRKPLLSRVGCQLYRIAPAAVPQGDSKEPDAVGGGVNPSLPTLIEGINVYCCWALGLIFLADFTPLGALPPLSMA